MGMRDGEIDDPVTESVRDLRTRPEQGRGKKNETKTAETRC